MTSQTPVKLVGCSRRLQGAVLHDTGIRKTLGATVTSETFIILQCLACQEVPRPRSVDCRPSVRLSCK